MALLKWDAEGTRLYETGVKNCALYTMGASGYNKGVAWNGITGITESPSGAEETALYADDIKYLSLRSAEELGGTIEAYMYPDEWKECDGSASVGGMTVGQQTRKAFAIAYITTVGNDTQSTDYGEKLHILYGATASPSERAYATINDSPEAITFSWEFTTISVPVYYIDSDGKRVDLKNASLITVDSADFNTAEKKAKYQALKDALFGRDANEDSSITELEPMLKMPNEVYAILNAAA